MAGIRISAWSIRNPIPITALFIGLLVAGLGSFFALPIKLLPDTSVPIISVTVTQYGAAAAEMEKQISRPIESGLSAVSGVKHVSTTITQGVSTTTAEFEYGSDVQKALEDVRTSVERTRVLLPQGIDPPTVQRLDFDATPVLTYAVSSTDKSVGELSWFVDDIVSRAIQGGKDVAQVVRVGGVKREINIILDPARMMALGVTAPQVSTAVRQSSQDDSGGRASLGEGEQIIRVLGAADTVDNLRAMTIPLSNGSFVTLGNLATVEMGAADERDLARLDGRPVVGFQVQKTKQGSDVTAESSVHRALAELRKAHPDVTFTEVLSTARQTKMSFDSTLHVLIEGMVLAAIVVLMFLRDWRATLIAAVAMPLSLIPTFAAMLFLGFSLNGLTLLALTLVIGILVDDAIVEIENIEKRIEAGMSPYRASLVGADAIGLAVVATTATIVAVFTPVAFMGGIAGAFFREFGLTVAISVAFSLLVARLVTPVMTAYFLKEKKHAAPVERMPKFYQATLNWALAHKWITAGIGVLAFVLAMGLAVTRPVGFQPVNDSGNFYVSLRAAPGAGITGMDDAVNQATRILKAKPDVDQVFARIGDGSEIGTANLIVVLKHHRSQTTDNFMIAIRPQLRDIPDVRIAAMAGFAAADINVTLTGDDPDLLSKTQSQLMQEMAGLTEISGVRPTPPPSSTELVIRPRPAEAARLGVTSQDIASVIRIATIGDIDANVAKFTRGEERIPIRVRLPLNQRNNFDQISQLRVPTHEGSTPLSTVATLTLEAGPGQIIRLDRRRQVTIEADLEGVAAGVAYAKIRQLPTMKALPAGIHEAAAGQQEQIKELFAGFLWAICSGIFLIYAVMALLFGSFFKPLTIMTALPLVALGAFGAMALTGTAVTLPVLIGLLMLLGLAGKNSILLVEFIIERERAGETRLQAIQEACRERARPIVMTTLAMIAGMVPTALALGEGSAFRQPMSIAVIGGLISSTVLSLVLVPVAYEIVDDIEKAIKRRLSGLVTKKRPGDDAPIHDGDDVKAPGH